MLSVRDFLYRRRTAVGALIVLLTGVALYGYSVTLPYHIDDFVQFRWLAARSLSDVWFVAAGLSYYRPLSLSIWKLIYIIAGAYPSSLIHALNVITHAVTGVFLYALVKQYWYGNKLCTLAAIVPALLFLFFPFSYQAIPWVGALYHPLVMLLITGALLMAGIGAERRRWPTRAGALCLTLLAPFAHETGVLIAPILTLLCFTLPHGSRPSLKHALKSLWPYWVCSLLAAAVMMLVRNNSGLHSPSIDWVSIWQNAVYYLQGLAYPIAPFAQRLRELFPGLNDVLAVLVVCIPALALLAVLCFRAGYGRTWLLAMGWYVVMIAPAWFLLHFSYVVDGPRLMYESSPGAAMLWSLPMVIAINRVTVRAETLSRSQLHLRVGSAIAAILFTVGTLAGCLSFLMERADMYNQTRLAADGLLASVSTTPASKSGILSVNFPGWIAPKTSTYALGHEGVTFIPDYSSVIDLVWTMTGQEHMIPNVVVQELQSHWRFNYRNYGAEWQLPVLQAPLRQMQKVLFTSYRSANLATYDVGALEYENTPRASKYVSAYDGKLALISGEWHIANHALLVTLHWQSWMTLTQEVRTYVHLQSNNGELVAQEDGLPLMGIANPLWWKPGDQWRDMRVLVLPDDLKPGDYTLRVGVYPAAGGNRYNATDSSGVRYPADSATLGVFSVP